MRYLDTVTFVYKSKNEYDPTVGAEKVGEIKQTKRLAHIVTPSIKQSSLLVGDSKATDLVIHLKQPFTEKYTYILLLGKKYYFVNQKKIGRRQIIMVSGENNGINN